MTDARAIDTARGLLVAEDEPTRLRGVHLLRDHGVPRNEAAALLVRTLAQPGHYVSHAARAALQTMGAEALAAVLAGLTDADHTIRAGCCWSLAAPQGASAGEVAAAVAALADDGDETVRVAVAAALGRIGGAPEPRAAALRRLASDPARRVRVAALCSLGLEAALAERGRPALAGALDDPLAEVRLAAVESLRALSPDAALAARVRQALDEEVAEHLVAPLRALLETWAGVTGTDGA